MRRQLNNETLEYLRENLLNDAIMLEENYHLGIEEKWVTLFNRKL